MKLAVLGGSFNPVHMGHLFLADEVISRFGYDRVILVPAYQSPFKINADGASPKERIEMLAASIAGDPRLTVDNCELEREGVSYTVDTLIDIIDRYRPSEKPGLILGDDLVSSFNEWQRPDEIARLADFIIARREETDPLSAEQRSTGSFTYPYKALNNERIHISSSDIREKIARGEAWRYLVPSGARCVIEDLRLYGFAGNSPKGNAASGVETDKLSEIIIKVENEVRFNLNFERFMHSRNTALLSWDLCGKFGLDRQKGYLAGIAHDMCKGLSEDKLFRLAHADGGSISKLERSKPSLLHARAGAVMLRKKYGISDKDILEAIRYHTTGVRDMCPLAKVVYVADKIEVSRIKVDPMLREISMDTDLDVLFETVLNNTVSYLRSRSLDISYGTRRLLAAMNKRNIQ